MTALARIGASRFAGAPNYAPSTSLVTPTYDGSGVTTEPTWIAKPSWVTATGTDLLAHNPLTGGSSAVENPSILISNDNGSTWATPTGVTNPISGPPAGGAYADCHLFADPNTNRLVMSWVLTSATPTSANGLFYSVCTDPTLVTWGAATQLIAQPTLWGPNEQEPKTLWDSVRGKYVLFSAVSAGAASTWGMQLRLGGSTTPLSGYGSPTACTVNIPGGNDAGFWHMDVIQEASGRFVMAFCDTYTPTGLARRLWLASSPNGIGWRVAPRPLMLPNSWAASGLYRPTIQPARTGNGYDIIVARAANPDSRLGIVRNVPKTEVP